CPPQAVRDGCPPWNGQEPETIIALARAVSDGHLAGAVAPVAKHLPGHGRSKADSHLALPVVDTPYDELARTDFAPFVALADLPAGMTAHIVYTALDEQECASTSARIISNIIRGQFGFDGLLMSDDLSMAALTGSIADRTARVRRAGCDIALHCNGRLDEMVEVADAAGMLGEDGVRRLRDLHAARGQPEPYDRAAAERMRDALLASAPV
ncbi:MAG: glycoside hydrolase family 3 N-terminal domain-containing protein, partial [Pseudomonadota bacterium]